MRGDPFVPSPRQAADYYSARIMELVDDYAAKQAKASPTAGLARQAVRKAIDAMAERLILKVGQHE